LGGNIIRDGKNICLGRMEFPSSWKVLVWMKKLGAKGNLLHLSGNIARYARTPL
jgi:hypothetical protein